MEGHRDAPAERIDVAPTMTMVHIYKDKTNGYVFCDASGLREFSGEHLQAELTAVMSVLMNEISTLQLSPLEIQQAVMRALVPNG